MFYEINAKKAISRTKIPVSYYTINPYIGCTVGCRYCFAQFIGQFKNTAGKWGKDVYIKKNLIEVLNREIGKTPYRNFFISTNCDAYQHIEKKYELTRNILKRLISYDFPIFIMTKSNLILRDIDLLKLSKKVYIMITVTTDNDDMRKIFEPGANSIPERIELIEKLNGHNIPTDAFIGPALPMNSKRLANRLVNLVGKVHIDDLNYKYRVRDLYKKYKLEKWLNEESFTRIKNDFFEVFGKDRIS